MIAFLVQWVERLAFPHMAVELSVTDVLNFLVTTGQLSFFFFREKRNMHLPKSIKEIYVKGVNNGKPIK